ncbi:MAG: polyprenyl synthetase family protein [Myxococcales bacterium]|nr:polyprenyl synthetase family protein [Myxococcales bacterium]MCB9731777.1 polyprenyl synthetase family protein [Deltaproteobacteria bacterium]
MTERPADWPAAGPIDLARQDLPHRSAVTEWWYVNAHLETVDGRSLSLFASFFRIAKGRDEATNDTLYAHSVSWALSDLDAKRYYPDTLVDRDAPRLALERLDRGEGATKDPRIRRALREVLERGNVPYPDHMFEAEPYVNARQLELEYGPNRFARQSDGSYTLTLFHEYFECGADLVLRPEKAAVRHGEDGVVRGHDGADMFYYFVPRCAVSGTVTLNGLPVAVASGAGWYDHEFGGHRSDEAEPNEHVAWNWVAAQLADGREVSAYTMIDVKTGDALGQRAVVIGADGRAESFAGLSLEPVGSWRSTRTFNTYPTRWHLRVPDARLDLELEAAFEDQELITLISKPAFWEGRVAVAGHIDGKPVAGRGYVERSGFLEVSDLDGFFKAVGQEVRRSVANLLPYEPSYERVRDLIASESRDHYMEGVDLQKFVKTGVVPVREITDRGGKGWRSYAALACCDVVGGDSRDYVHWLAMPELMHVGSLIVDDVQDRSTVRRGGPTCHEAHGDALAINAGTSCYFMGQHLLSGTQVSNVAKLALYDLYFEALRAGHAGQAADIEGLDDFVPKAIETGDTRDLESRVLAIHRLKTAAPAGALSRMGAVVGAGKPEQVEALGRYFEAIGLSFQIVDDVLNLRGFAGNLKHRGEDIAHGKVTLPVAKAFGRLGHDERVWLWETLRSRPQDQDVVEGVIARLEEVGAIEACAIEARERLETAWELVQPLLEDSIVKIMLRAFGYYVLERHY